MIQILVRVLGVLTIVGALYYGVTSESQMTKGEIFHLPSFTLVVLVVLGVMMSSYQVTRIADMLKNLFTSSPSRAEKQLKLVSVRLQEMSEAYYREGGGALKRFAAGSGGSPLWESVFNQLEAKIEPTDVKNLLRYDAKNFEDELNSQINILSGLSNIAPSVGVFGTVLGLIKLLADLKDLDSLGPNMSLALVTTLYGLVISVLVFHPLVTRLEAVRDVKLKAYQQAFFWVNLIEQGKPAFFGDPKYFSSSSKKGR